MASFPVIFSLWFHGDPICVVVRDDKIPTDKKFLINRNLSMTTEVTSVLYGLPEKRCAGDCVHISQDDIKNDHCKAIEVQQTSVIICFRDGFEPRYFDGADSCGPFVFNWGPHAIPTGVVDWGKDRDGRAGGSYEIDTEKPLIDELQTMWHKLPATRRVGIAQPKCSQQDVISGHCLHLAWDGCCVFVCYRDEIDPAQVDDHGVSFPEGN